MDHNCCLSLALLCIVFLELASAHSSSEENDDDYVPRVFGGRRNTEDAGILPPHRFVSRRSLPNVKVRTVTQKLDHFTPTIFDEWEQRYMINDQYYKSCRKGPIFLVIAGEWTLSEDEVSSGQVERLARKHNALILGLEHRFYGESRPTSDTSNRNLRFLSSHQAIEDITHFIREIRLRYMYRNKHRKIIMFGCSYAGSLAAVHRSKYPRLTAGAITNCAPMEARENYDCKPTQCSSDKTTQAWAVKLSLIAFLTLFFSHLNGRAHSCGNMYMQAFLELNHIIRDRDQMRLKAVFNLCSPGVLDFTNQNSIDSFNYDAVTVLMQAVQYDRPRQGLDSDLGRMCQVMLNDSIGAPLDRYGAWLKSVDPTCLLNQGKPYAVKSTSWSNRYVARGARQWLYQMCSEFGYFTPNEWSTMGPNITLNFLKKSCEESFGIIDVGRGVRISNEYFWGPEWNGSNVYFLVGMRDPWNFVTMTPKLPTGSQSVWIMVEMSHCDEPAGVPTDSPKLLGAWEEIDKYIAKWIS